MMKKIIPLLTLFSFFELTSCKKTTDEGPAIQASTTSTIKVPTGFSWENSRNINFTVNITDSRFQGVIYRVAIYDGNPATGANLLSKGSATISSAFASKLYLSKEITTVYIVKTAADGSTATQIIQVGSADITTSIGA